MTLKFNKVSSRSEYPHLSAVCAQENDFGGAVRSGNSVKADLYHVLGGQAERRLPQVTTSFAYRAPDKTFWFSGERCLWHLVEDDFVRVNLPLEMVNQYQFLQTITGDQQGGIWVSFGRHGLYRLANGSWTPYGGRDDLAHFSKFVPPGSVWIGSSQMEQLGTAGFLIPEGKIVLIASNTRNFPKEFAISYHGTMVMTTIPAESVGTYVW